MRDHLQFHAWGSAAERTHCRKWETVYIAYTYYKSRTRTIQVKRYYTSPYRAAQKRQTTTRIYITTFVVGYRAGSQPADVVVFLIKNQLVETSLFSLSLLVLCVCRKSRADDRNPSRTDVIVCPPPPTKIRRRRSGVYYKAQRRDYISRSSKENHQII